MARQSTTPVSFPPTVRSDRAVLMSSARAGVVVPVGYIPLLAGDSCSGRIGIDVSLKEMPKPLLNAVTANFQAWFVPKSAHPQFSGRDELNHARIGQVIKALGAADRTPPPFFNVVTQGTATGNTIENSEMFKVLGLHLPAGDGFNTDLIDAFNLVHNFRLAAHSSRLTRRPYATEDIDLATRLPRAFWPSSRLSRVVPDYERALVVGALDLDVVAGRLPVTGIGWASLPGTYGTNYRQSDGTTVTGRRIMRFEEAGWSENPSRPGYPNIFAEMGGQTMGITLADIDKARTTQAFAKLRTAYAGNDSTGFDNDDVLVSLLMQGIAVPPEDFKRPWLLDQKRVPVNFAQRYASDGDNLEKSVSRGRSGAVLSLNVPRQDVSGVIIVTCEVLPERIDERMSDGWLSATHVDHLPNALRDVQRVEPVDLVRNQRVDAKHSAPWSLYGYEPMNDKWNRDFTRLGGDFYMRTPGGGWTENRSNIWQTEIVNPTLSGTHYLAPYPFPHSVFSDANADAFEFVARHDCRITGLTQIGDVLVENSDDYEAVQEAGV